MLFWKNYFIFNFIFNFFQYNFYKLFKILLIKWQRRVGLFDYIYLASFKNQIVFYKFD